MATAEGRCGPLCQHPGCWYSEEKHKVAYHKSQGYLTYLQGLASKRSSVAEQQSNSTAEDGLPTLKIQTLDEGSIVSGDRALGSRRRARTLPSLGTRTRCKTPGSGLFPQCPSTSRRLTFAHVVLEDEGNTTAADKITFSPVLIWKPGRRIFRPLRTAEGGGPPVWAACVKSSGGIGKAGVSRSQVSLRTMNLTDALPPERSESARSGGGKGGGRKAMPRSTKGHRQPPTADAESFSYLGDIPPHVVAHILEQLRSESSSHIGDERSRPITSTSVHQQLPVEAEATNANVNTNNSNNNGGHIPSSLVHDLSTGKQYRTSEHHYVTPPHSSRHTYASGGTRKKTFGSFSRELSRRPLEVLRRYSVRPSLEGVAESTGGQAQEGVLQHQTECDSRNIARVGLGAAHTYSPPLPLQKPPKHLSPRLPVDGASAAYGAAGIHPSLAGTRYPHGNPVIPRIPQQSEEKSGISTCKDTRYAKVPDGKSAVRNTLLLPNDLTLPYPSSASPRTVTFQSGILGSLMEAELSSRVAAGRKGVQSPKRSSRVVYVPRHNPPASADSYTLRPFSEEDSTIVAPAETKPISEPFVSSEPQTPEVPQSQESSSHQLVHPRPDSLSPDYMLVGAHISGDQLVLLDGGSQIIHQLTDTESDANVLAYSESHAYVTHSTSSSENPISGSLETPCTGTRAPPSTASHGMKTAMQGNKVGTDNRQTSTDHKHSTDTATADENTPVQNFEPSSPSEVEHSEVTASGEIQMIPASAAHEGPEISCGSEGGTRTSLTGDHEDHCSGSLDCADTNQGASDSLDTMGRDETCNRGSETIDESKMEGQQLSEALNDPTQPT